MGRSDARQSRHPNQGSGIGSEAKASRKAGIKGGQQ